MQEFITSVDFILKLQLFPKSRGKKNFVLKQTCATFLCHARQMQLNIFYLFFVYKKFGHWSRENLIKLIPAHATSLLIFYIYLFFRS